MTTVTIKHLKALNYCNRGSREWMRSQGIEWSDFLTNGIPCAEKIAEKTGDSMALRLVLYAREDERKRREEQHG